MILVFALTFCYTGLPMEIGSVTGLAGLSWVHGLSDSVVLMKGPISL